MLQGCLVCPNVQTVPPSAGYLKTGMPDHPQVTKGLNSRFGLDFVEVPSLRRRSVGPRRTDIHVLTALSPHPCGSTHCASSAFGLRPSRVLRCLDLLRMKIKIKSAAQINGFPAEAGPTGCARCLWDWL